MKYVSLYKIGFYPVILLKILKTNTFSFRHILFVLWIGPNLNVSIKLDTFNESCNYLDCNHVDNNQGKFEYLIWNLV